MATRNCLIAWVLLLVLVLFLTSEGTAREFAGRTSNPYMTRSRIRELAELNGNDHLDDPRKFHY
ncbi:hypothetical protein Ddye_013368 [Dipteronia dyeriana]|uniref:Uncharacterized protein n=1 Tax=Dipteronia dyeriana TaxID=168575 RepID=A0AAD9X6B0_9ROSI|nr:hypothetical protein Ddye_013368 [Dipteronia dyeriana]